MGERFQAKVTSKGQLTLPRAVRRALGVGPGDQVAFDVTREGVTVQPVRPESVFQAFAGRSRDGAGLTREEINAWLRDIRGHNEADL
jgi:AbrB family looped-hinge helix DNA binding protein